MTSHSKREGSSQKKKKKIFTKLPHWNREKWLSSCNCFIFIYYYFIEASFAK